MLTQDEYNLNEELGQCFTHFQLLPVVHPADRGEFMAHIHAAQNIVLARAGLRDPRYTQRLPRPAYLRLELRDSTGVRLAIGDRVTIDLDGLRDYVSRHFSSNFSLTKTEGVILGEARFAENALVSIPGHDGSPAPIPRLYLTKQSGVDPVAADYALALELTSARERLEAARVDRALTFQQDEDCSAHDTRIRHNEHVIIDLSYRMATLYIARQQTEEGQHDVTE